MGRRSLNKAADEHDRPSKRANGGDEQKAEAKQQLLQIALDQPIVHSCTAPRRSPDVFDAILFEWQYPFSSIYTLPKMPVAATLLAADLIRTAGFSEEAVFVNLAIFAANGSGTGPQLIEQLAELSLINSRDEGSAPDGLWKDSCLMTTWATGFLT